MTNVAITKNSNSIVCVECDGHTGYGVEGEDIVCSALSSIVQTALLGLVQVAGVDVDYQIVDVDAYLKMELPKQLTPAQQHDADIILNTMLLGIQDLYEGFSDFISLEVK
ncbi:MAG: ribosomal-processing cysteine protease Prp [Clostridia bacterium]